jgi:hypothetical protein
MKFGMDVMLLGCSLKLYYSSTVHNTNMTDEQTSEVGSTFSTTCNRAMQWCMVVEFWKIQDLDSEFPIIESVGKKENIKNMFPYFGKNSWK